MTEIVKISELTAAAALTGDESVPITQDGVTVRATAQDIADLGGGGGTVDYAVGFAGVATVLGVPTLLGAKNIESVSNPSTGQYNLAFSEGAFGEGNTIIQVTLRGTGQGGRWVAVSQGSDETGCTINIYNDADVATNSDFFISVFGDAP